MTGGWDMALRGHHGDHGELLLPTSIDRVRSGWRLPAVTLIVALSFALTLPAQADADPLWVNLVAETPTPSTPATHTYDDSHIRENRSASLPALWILLGAVGGLAVITVALVRSGRAETRH